MYVLAEVKECGGEEWVLEAGDLPAQRFLLWPRKAQEQHPQSLGFYFLLQVRVDCMPEGCKVFSITAEKELVCVLFLLPGEES